MRSPGVGDRRRGRRHVDSRGGALLYEQHLAENGSEDDTIVGMSNVFHDSRVSTPDDGNVVSEWLARRHPREQTFQPAI